MSDLYRDLGLTIVPPRAADAGKSFSDAEHECKHGRLPGDSTPPCGCWAGEVPRVDRSRSPRKVVSTDGRDY
jgi:hypothetical protein